MKLFLGKKPGSASVVLAVTAIALIGFTAVAISRGLDNWKLKSKVKIADMDSQIEAIIRENVSLRQSASLLSVSLDNIALQNEKLAVENGTLALALQEEHDRVLRLMNLMTDESEEKLALMQQLEDAAGKSDSARYPAAEQSKEFIA